MGGGGGMGKVSVMVQCVEPKNPSPIRISRKRLPPWRPSFSTFFCRFLALLLLVYQFVCLCPYVFDRRFTFWRFQAVSLLFLNNSSCYLTVLFMFSVFLTAGSVSLALWEVMERHTKCKDNCWVTGNARKQPRNKRSARKRLLHHCFFP